MRELEVQKPAPGVYEYVTKSGQAPLGGDGRDANLRVLGSAERL